MSFPIPRLFRSNSDEVQSSNVLIPKGRLNEKVVIAIKVVVGVVIVAAAIGGFILLEKKSPKIAIGLAGGMSMSIATLKLINYTTKLAPKDQSKEAEIVAQEKARIAAIESFSDFKKELKNYQLTSKPNYIQYYEIFIKVQIGPKAGKELKPDQFKSKFTVEQRFKILKKASLFLKKDEEAYSVFKNALSKSELNCSENRDLINQIDETIGAGVLIASASKDHASRTLAL